MAGAIVIDKRKFYRRVPTKVDPPGGLLLRNKRKPGPYLPGEVAEEFRKMKLTTKQARDFLEEGKRKSIYGKAGAGEKELVTLLHREGEDQTTLRDLGTKYKQTNLVREFALLYYEHDMDDSGETEDLANYHDEIENPIGGWRYPSHGAEDLVELGEVTGYPLPEDNPNKVAVQWGWTNPDESRIVFSRFEIEGYDDVIGNPRGDDEIDFMDLLAANSLHQDQWGQEVLDHPVLKFVRFKLKQKDEEPESGGSME